MEYYIEIRLLSDPEFSPAVLMNALFAKLHRALVEAGHEAIGVSFPQAQKTLGDSLRLHGSLNALQRIMALNWLKGLRDYSYVSEILPVPSNCRYRVVKRLQAKSSAERLYRRSVKKGWVTAEEAEEKIAASKEQRLKHPYIQLKSNSSGQVFRLFIHQGALLNSAQEGKFSDYGLSVDATIPWF